MFSVQLKFLLFIFVAFGTLLRLSGATNSLIGTKTCCEARLWPDECLPQIFNESSRNALSKYCRLAVNLCCLLDQDNLPCDPRSSKFGSGYICSRPDQDHCCVACKIGEELADRDSDCSATELRKFVTKQDAVVLQITMECCKQRKTRRDNLNIEGRIRAGKVLRYNRSTNKTEDIDECQIKNNGCYRSQRCVNKYGSYVCQPRDVCKNGFRFSKVMLACNDIDECHERRWACLKGEVCSNILGSFTCDQPKCPKGYNVSYSKRWSNYNKCVRKTCAIEGEKCETQPKYLIFKNFTLSTDMNVIKGIALYSVYSKRFKIKPTYKLNVLDNNSGIKLDQHDFQLVEQKTRTVIVLNKPFQTVQELKVTVEVTRAEKTIEIVTINLSVREN